jgi:hypothetical protein
MVHCFRLLDVKHTDRHILSLEAFLKPERDQKTDPDMARGAQ